MTPPLETPLGGRQGVAAGTPYAIEDGVVHGIASYQDALTIYALRRVERGNLWEASSIAAGYQHTLLLMLFGLGWMAEGGEPVEPPIVIDPGGPISGQRWFFRTRRRR